MCFGHGSSQEEQQKNRHIRTSLINDAKKESNTISLLLLGAGESGKSTILKQLKILHLNGFTHEEYDDFKRDVRLNVLQTICALVRTALSQPELAISPELMKDAKYLSEIHEYAEELTPELGTKVVKLWKDRAIRAVYSRKNQIQIQSNAEHLMESVERIAALDYNTSVEDVLHCRVRTTGVVEIKFTVEETRFRIMDVGGQRSERKKWMHFFDGVAAVLYVAALDEYDLTLFEDETTNRMMESLRLFDEMGNNEVFAKTPTILFLNKKDLLKQKLGKAKLSQLFPEYQGGSNYKEACNFIKSKYLALNHTEKTMYHESIMIYSGKGIVSDIII